MTYQDFKANFPIGSSVASPEGTYKGQCVSYVRQYMALVHGVITGPLGNAVDFASNPTFLNYYQKVATPQAGDIMVWGDDAGTWTSIYGHIAIYDGSGYMMNQNFNGSLKVSRNAIFTPGFIGYFRRKGTGGEEVREPSKDEVNAIYIACCNRSASDAEVRNYTQHPFDVCFLEVYNSAESIAWRKKANASDASAADKLERIKAIVA